MFCHYCLSYEQLPLVGMQSHYLEQNGLQISYLDCFKQCKQIKIEDEQTAKICTSCISILTEEYTLKQLITDQANCVGSTVGNNLDFSVASIKEESKFNINSWCISNDGTPTKNHAVNQAENNVENSIKIESTMVESVPTIYQIVMFPVSEIKQEAELQIGDAAEPSWNLTSSRAPG
jgi:hypothetical protein